MRGDEHHHAVTAAPDHLTCDVNLGTRHALHHRFHDLHDP